MTESVTGVVTFLFTDIEGATRMWEEEPEAMRFDHDQLLTRTIEDHGGHLFKHTGHGVLAVFESPPRASQPQVASSR